jgi:hypothetical protein
MRHEVSEEENVGVGKERVPVLQQRRFEPGWRRIEGLSWRRQSPEQQARASLGRE